MVSVEWTTKTLVVATFFVALILGLFLRKKRNKINLPPGPKPWPIIGNLNLIGLLPHQSIHAQSLKYGEIMYLRFGSLPTVVASSAQMAREFLKTHDHNFSSRKKISAGKYLMYNYCDILYSPYNAYLQKARKICIVELFSKNRLDQYRFVRVEAVQVLLKTLFSKVGQKVNLKHHLMTMNFELICRMVLGDKYQDGSKALKLSGDEYKKVLKEFFLLNGVLNIGDYIPCLSFFDVQGYIKRMKVVSKKIDEFLENILDEHIKSRRHHNSQFSKDMVDVLIDEFTNESDPTLDVKLNRDRVKGITGDLIAGGSETSEATLEWIMAELLRNPHIMSKAKEELDRVIGKERWVDEQDISNLPFIECIVKETMRLHPLGPLLVPRMSTEDCNIGGYDIPAGTQIIVNTWTIGRDPNSYDKPLEFRPERFADKEIDVRGHHYQLLPFGSGRRMCPAYNLGWKVVVLALSNMIHGFQWKLPKDMKPEDLSMEEVFGLSTHRKHPLEVLVHPSLSPHLYI